MLWVAVNRLERGDDADCTHDVPFLLDETGGGPELGGEPLNAPRVEHVRI